MQGQAEEGRASSVVHVRPALLPAQICAFLRVVVSMRVFGVGICRALTIRQVILQCKMLDSKEKRNDPGQPSTENKGQMQDVMWLYTKNDKPVL